MKKLLFTIGILVFISGILQAQVVTIIDESTLQPIQDVTVYNGSFEKFVISNQKGKVDLTKFNDDEQLIFQHPAYKQVQFDKANLLAQDHEVLLTEKVIHIDEVVISANKWEQKTGEVPHKITSITPKDMAFDNAQTAADMLVSTGQVYVQKSQLGGGSPMMRGFGANSVMIVVDGVRMNNAIFRSGNLQNVINIDPNMLEGAEVIFGPGSVIYGSDAMGGVMDFHTKEVGFSEDSFLANGMGMLRYASANHEKTAHLQWNLAGQQIGYFGGITLSDYDDLRSGRQYPDDYPDFGKREFYVQRINGRDSVINNDKEHVQKPSGFKQLNTVQKLKWNIAGNTSLEYIFNLSTTSDIPRYDRLIETENGMPVNAEWYYGPQFWMMNAVKLNINRSGDLFDQSRLTLAKQDFEESRHDRDFGSDILRSRTEEVDVYSLNLDFEKALNDNNELYYGMEYYYNKVHSNAQRRNIVTNEITPSSTRYPDGGSDMHRSAAYVSWKYQLTDQLIINSGARFSYSYLLARLLSDQFPFDKIENRNSALNGNLGLVFRPDEHWQINLMGSTGFRAPNVDDVAKVFDSEPGNVIVPNPSLKPEYAYNTELSVRKRWGDFAEIKGVVFHTWLQDAMVRSDFTFNGEDSIIYDGTLSNVQALVNTGRARIFGFDISAKFELSDRWGLSTHLNQTNGEDLVNNEPLRHTTPLFGKTALYFHSNNFRGEFYARYNGKRSYEDLPPSEKNKPHMYTDDGSLGWYTLNIKGAYHFNQNITINAAIENILDYHYRPYSSGISAPGRNFIISVKGRF